MNEDILNQTTKLFKKTILESNLNLDEISKDIANYLYATHNIDYVTIQYYISKILSEVVLS